MQQAADQREVAPDGMRIVDLVQRLRDASGVPINLIEDRVLNTVHWTTEDAAVAQKALGAGDVPTVLNLLVAHTSGYVWRSIRGRDVLFPDDEPAWLEPLDLGRNIAGPRLNAAAELLQSVTEQVPSLSDLTGPPMRGDPNLPIFTDHVVAQSGIATIEQFVELLGDDRQLAFTVEAGPGGHRVLHFQLVRFRPTPQRESA